MYAIFDSMVPSSGYTVITTFEIKRLSSLSVSCCYRPN